MKEGMNPLHMNCIVGGNQYLLDYLKVALEKAVKVDIIVAFLMESGVRLLQQDLKAVVERGVPIRILTGNYLNITQPQALYLLKDTLADKVDLRFYNVKNKSFHPKAYIFEYADGGGDVFIGSSNISASALTTGIEWNYRVSKELNESDFKFYKEVFENLFLNYSIIIDDEELRNYSKQWKKPKSQFFDEESSEDEKVIPMIQPRGAQIEALYELKKSRIEGQDKGIVVASTGIGKTYLAAFDSKEFKKVLFVAHREEILRQAEITFKNVRPKVKTGFFMGTLQDTEYDILFATVQTLGKKRYLTDEYFSKTAFDYVIIDEFHHAVAANYQNIIEYFTPKFLLGLTATPERMDNEDVFALCDYNVVYEVRLKESINKGWLVPFRYYGIYDSTDYSQIDYKNGKYDEKQLEQALMLHKRADLIFNHYQKFKSQRCLGFCTSRNHANYMAQYFTEKGIPACAVVSGENLEYSVERQEAVQRLVKGELKVIFSVDMFNEGLDIPSLDMLMFLRPTQSPTIFLQQLGRGLRKCTGKSYVNILDFIGNYKKAHLIPFFLCGNVKGTVDKITDRQFPQEVEYPEDCIVDFDFQLIDIFKKQAQQQKKMFNHIVEDYYRIKEDLQHRPSRLEMYTYLDDELYNNIRAKKDLNIFNDYLQFLYSLGELTEDETALLDTFGYTFLTRMENTKMSKTYKMPLLLAFYNDADMKAELTEEEIYRSFKKFYSKGANAVDLLRDKSGQNYKEWGSKEYLKIAQNPIQAFLKTETEFFTKEENIFALAQELIPYIQNDSFVKHFKDVIDYRTRRFYKERLESQSK